MSATPPSTGDSDSDESDSDETAIPASTGGKNSNLSAAKHAKNDEFYTQWADIEREMNAYLEYDPDVFRGKTVLLPCDDPEWSNFTKFFALLFSDYGLKKLISTSYAPDSKPATLAYQPTLFETQAAQYDKSKTRANGKMFVLEAKDINGDGVINIEDLEWEYLQGDGDFRSEEVTALRDEADVVVTNPPFSLFREFLAWLVEGGVKFSIIGTRNAITYRDVFPLIMQNKIWLGKGFAKGDAYFRVPESAKNSYASGVYDPKTQLVHFRNTTWLTNMDHGRRHEPLALMTMEDNTKFSKHKAVRGVGYHAYDNFDAIEVPYTDAIPSDYDGVMGVPITFLDKYNPDQFEIIGNGQTTADEIGIRPVGQEFVDKYYEQGNKGQINAKWNNLVYRIGEKVVVPYQRILIRRKISS